MCNSNTIDHIPSDFEWWDEIDNFIKDPDAALEAQEVIAGELEESMQSLSRKKKKEKFTNCFGLEMERETQLNMRRKIKIQTELTANEIFELFKRQFRRVLAVDTEFRFDITKTIPEKVLCSFILMSSTQIRYLDSGKKIKTTAPLILIAMFFVVIIQQLIWLLLETVTWSTN